MVRVTKTTGTIIIVDYASPRNKISRFLVFHFVKLFEHYYPGFIKSDLKGLLKKSGIWILEEHTLLLGSASIRKGVIDHIP